MPIARRVSNVGSLGAPEEEDTIFLVRPGTAAGPNWPTSPAGLPFREGLASFLCLAVAATPANLGAFCEVCFPKLLFFRWSTDHQKLIPKIEAAVTDCGSLFALSLPRGSGKTTLCLCAVIWALVTGHHLMVALIAAEGEAAEELLDDIKTELETNDKLLDYWPEVCCPHPEDGRHRQPVQGPNVRGRGDSHAMVGQDGRAADSQWISLQRRQQQAKTHQGHFVVAMLITGLALLFSDAQASYDDNSVPPSKVPPSPEVTSVENLLSTVLEGMLRELPEKAPLATANNNVRHGDGNAMLASLDSFIPTFVDFDHTRTFSGKSTEQTSQDTWFGGAVDCHLTEYGAHIDAHLEAHSTIRFEWSGTEYTSPDGSPWGLTHESADDEFHLCNKVTGELLIFHDFDGNNTDGKMKEKTTLNWDTSKTGWTFTHNANGRLSSVTGPTGSSKKVNYIYDGGDRLIRVEAEDMTDSSYFITIYNNYKQGYHHADVGPADALAYVEVEYTDADVDGPKRDTQYRYYSDGKLKAEYSSDAIHRIIQDNSNITTADDILAKADSYSTGGTEAIEDFATRAFEYHVGILTTSVDTVWTNDENLDSKYGALGLDETDFVSIETLRSVAAGSSSASQVEKRYYYLTNVAAGHTADNVNSVERIIVEDTVDGAGNGIFRKVTGVNESGRLLRRVLIDDPSASSPQYWCQSWKLDDDENVIEYRQPSAHSVDSDADVAKFLDGHSGTNDGDTLHDTSGVIYSYTINADGRRTETKVQEGETGTAHFVSATDYYGGTNDQRKYLVTASYRYPTKTTTKTSGEKTEYTYTFWTGSDTVKTIKTTLPMVATAQNGSGVATESWQYFDLVGSSSRPVACDRWLSRAQPSRRTGRATRRIGTGRGAGIGDRGSGRRRGRLACEGRTWVRASVVEACFATFRRRSSRANVKYKREDRLKSSRLPN